MDQGLENPNLLGQFRSVRIPISERWADHFPPLLAGSSFFMDALHLSGMSTAALVGNKHHDWVKRYSYKEFLGLVGMGSIYGR
jgi:hypothetical protein